MKNIFCAVIIFVLLFASVLEADTQAADVSVQAFDTTGFPQWAKDLRRWEIIAFGSFPFSMFVSTFAMDLYRWNNANGMDFNDRRYAPRPLKQAGAVEMTKQEYEKTILIAAGISAAVAIVDLIIVNTKRYKERRRIESMPTGAVVITRTPYGIIEEEIEDTDTVTVIDYIE